jgi:hypothetical protein
MKLLNQFEVGALIALAVSDGPADYEYLASTSTLVSKVPTMKGAADSVVELGLATINADRLTLTGAGLSRLSAVEAHLQPVL